MKHPILLALLAASSLSQAEVSVTAGDVSDNRTTGKFFAGLEIKLLVSGSELATAKGMRVSISAATDDTGKDLIDKKWSGFSGDEFRPLEEPFGPGPKKKGEFETSVKLANPPRTAKTVNLSGTIELLCPEADPASIVTADLAKVAGKALDAPALKAADVAITFNAPKGDEITYKIKDPGNKVASVEFYTTEGKPLETNGSSSMGFGTTKSCSVSVPNLPAKVTAKIYLLTPGALVKVPVKLEGISLP